MQSLQSFISARSLCSIACKTSQRTVLWVGVAVFLLAGCSPRHLIVQGVANELAAQGQAVEEDLVLVRESSAFYLKLTESLLREAPGNLKLAEAVVSGFTQYAYAFVSSEADRIDAKDAKAAYKLRERAARLYLRAYRHGLVALEKQQPGLSASLVLPSEGSSPRLKPDQVGLAYWTASAWGGFIALSKDNPDAVADLPAAIRLARLAWQVSPEHGQGALSSLMGTFEAARPGGSVTQAERYFDQAINLSQGKNAGAFVGKAESLALPAADRKGFDALLRQAIAASALEKNLQNEVMRERALWLLETADDLF